MNNFPARFWHCISMNPSAVCRFSSSLHTFQSLLSNSKTLSTSQLLSIPSTRPVLLHRNRIEISTITRNFSRSSIRLQLPHQMATKKVLVVFGATGIQGGSVVKAIMGDSKTKEAWTVRGVTRDTSKPSAKALEKLGAETISVRCQV